MPALDDGFIERRSHVAEAVVQGDSARARLRPAIESIRGSRGEQGYIVLPLDFGARVRTRDRRLEIVIREVFN